MPRLKNKRNSPLVVPVKEQGPIYFAPLEIKTVSEKTLKDPLIEANIRRGNLQVLPEGPVSLEPSTEVVPERPRRKGGNE